MAELPELKLEHSSVLEVPLDGLVTRHPIGAAMARRGSHSASSVRSATDSPEAGAQTFTLPLQNLSGAQTHAHPQPQAPRRPGVDLAAIRQLALPFVPGRLYFTSLSHHPPSTAKARFFTVDYDLAYEPYFADFGPLNISMLVRFSRALRERLDSVEADAEVYFYSSHTPHLRANAGYLIAGFAVLVLKWTPDAVGQLMSQAYPPLLAFRDASYGVANYQLTVFDIARALHKGRLLGWIDVDTFDVDEYERFDQITQGDWNWIVPRKFIAFSSPIDDMPGREAKKVVPAFRERGVSLVIRLNERKYDRRAFTEVGVRHEDLSFPDGSTPPDSIVRQFFELCEKQQGVAAVHCKAGLGRTGTLISLFMMKHFGFSSREAIAWCRVCRPGSVIGPQQQYLDTMQRRLDAAGEVYRRAITKDEAGAVLTGTAGPTSSVTVGAPSRPGTVAAGATRPGTRGTHAASMAGTATAEGGGGGVVDPRAKSPAQRSKPRPLKLVEYLPYDIPHEEHRKRVTTLQSVVSGGHAAAEAAAATGSSTPALHSTAQNRAGAPTAAAKPGTAAAGTRKHEKAAVSTSGVVRPLMAPTAATYVAGVTGGELDPRLKHTFSGS
jgi:cell division cycle 14